MESYISEIIAGTALLFSIYTQIKQGRSEKEIDKLKAEVFKKQSEINDLILEKEKNVEIHVSSKERASKGREIVFHNISNVNAESFNVEFNVECNGGFRWAAISPSLPTTLPKGAEISFKYSIVPATKGKINIHMSWINARTGEVQAQEKAVNLP